MDFHVCRQFIGGGTQDALPGAEPLPALAEPEEQEEDASGDLPPIMVGDSDMDAHIRAILDWRVGADFGKEKMPALVRWVCTVHGGT